jgi:hypothetical protein
MPGTLCSQKPYQNFGAPNVAAPVPPPPRPSINTSNGATRTPTNFRMLDTVLPFHTMRCLKPVSAGGLGPGIKSWTMFGPAQSLLPHIRMIIAAAPAQSFLSPHGQNGGPNFNCPGAVVTPPVNRFISLSG